MYCSHNMFADQLTTTIGMCCCCCLGVLLSQACCTSPPYMSCPSGPPEGPSAPESRATVVTESKPFKELFAFAEANSTGGYQLQPHLAIPEVRWRMLSMASFACSIRYPASDLIRSSLLVCSSSQHIVGVRGPTQCAVPTPCAACF